MGNKTTLADPKGIDIEPISSATISIMAAHKYMGMKSLYLLIDQDQVCLPAFYSSSLLHYQVFINDSWEQ
jgi:hypothetical protein